MRWGGGGGGKEGDLGDIRLFPWFRYGPENSEPVMSKHLTSYTQLTAEVISKTKQDVIKSQATSDSLLFLDTRHVSGAGGGGGDEVSNQIKQTFIVHDYTTPKNENLSFTHRLKTLHIK